jgi:hypothetical protein
LAFFYFFWAFARILPDMRVFYPQFPSRCMWRQRVDAGGMDHFRNIREGGDSVHEQGEKSRRCEAVATINYQEKGVVFDIQRFSVNDGPGIRSIVFLKGMPAQLPLVLQPGVAADRTGCNV